MDGDKQPWQLNSVYIDTYIHIYIYRYMDMYFCVHMCSAPSVVSMCVSMYSPRFYLYMMILKAGGCSNMFGDVFFQPFESNKGTQAFVQQLHQFQG